MASFTRQELYEVVRSKPIIQPGKELGISDQGISKACRRNDTLRLSWEYPREKYPQILCTVCI